MLPPPPPPNLQSKYNGCVTFFDVSHALSCCKVGLVISCHNKVCDKLLYLARWAFASAAVCHKLLIRQVCNISESKIRQGSDKLETWCGVIIWGLWDQQANSIIGVKLGNPDADSYRFGPMKALLARRENIKNYKHSKHWHDQQKRFSPFVIYVDGILDRKALVVLANLSQLVAAKMDKPISHVQGWMNGWIAIAVARSYFWIIHRDRLPSLLWEQETDWDLASGIGLAHQIAWQNNFVRESTNNYFSPMQPDK